MKVRSQIVAVAALAILPVLFFWRITLGGQVFFREDIASYFAPLRYSGSQMIRSGHVPLWLPDIYCGVPFLANIQNAVFYPFSTLFHLMPVLDAVTATLVFHTFLAGLFMFLFGRHTLKLNVFPSFVAGVVFMFSGFFGGNSSHLNQIISCPWLPLAMLFFALAADSGKLFHIALTGLILGIQFLGGGTQNSFHTFIALSLFALWATIQAVRSKKPPSIVLRPIVVLAAVVFLSISLAAIQLLPSYQLARYSFRAGGLPYSTATFHSLDPVQFVITLFFPHLFGNFANSYWGLSYFHETVSYVGILPLIFALFAVYTRREHSWVSFSVFLCVTSLFLALGRFNPIYVLFYDYAPGFDLFRVPARFIFLFTFAAATLCGIGIDTVLGSTAPLRWKGFGRLLAILSGIFGVIGLVLWIIAQREPEMVMWFAQWYGEKIGSARLLAGGPFGDGARTYAEMMRQSTSILNPWFGTSLITILLSLICFAFVMRLRLRPTFRTFSIAALVTFDLFFLSLGMMYNTTVPRKLAFHESKWLRFLKDNTGTYRIHTSHSKYLNPNMNLLFGLSDVSGYDGGLLPLKNYLPVSEMVTLEYPWILDLLNVKYIVSDKPLDTEGYEEVRSEEPYLYDNTDVLPKAFIVHQAIFLEDEPGLTRLKSPDFRPDEYVILEPTASSGQSGSETEIRTGDQAVRVLHYSPTEVVLETSSDADGFLVLCDTYYPNWRCYVDGVETHIYRANLYLRAIALPNGKHTVVFTYNSVPFTVGLLVSLVTLVASGVVVTVSLGSRRERDRT